jgi:hypothetical protein
VTMHAPLADRRMGTLVSRLDVSPATLFHQHITASRHTLLHPTLKLN